MGILRFELESAPEGLRTIDGLEIKRRLGDKHYGTYSDQNDETGATVYVIAVDDAQLNELESIR